MKNWGKNIPERRDKPGMWGEREGVVVEGDLRVGLHELAEVSLSIFLSVILSLAPSLGPGPAFAQAHGIFLCQLLRLYLPNS